MRRARKLAKYICIGLIVLVGVLFVYDRLARIAFVNNKAAVSQAYCKLFVRGEKLTSPVIFIPGTKGSTLSQGGKPVWLSAKQVLFSGKPLLYGPDDGVIATGIFTRLPIVPGIFEYQPYQKIAAQLACGKNAYFYYYDWRKSPIDNAEDLSSLVERVQQETSQKPSIVAHSMGGLITHYYLKDHSQSVNKVVYVGVPFQSGLSFLEDVDNGSAVGLNKTTLSKEALFTHPGSFALLPHPGSRLFKEGDLYDQEVWKQNKLSVYKDGVEDSVLLRNNLEQARKLFAVLDAPQALPNKFLLVVGNCQETLSAIGSDGYNTFEPGDTRVLAAGAMPAYADTLQKKIVYSCAQHDALLSDAKALKEIVGFLQ